MAPARSSERGSCWKSSTAFIGLPLETWRFPCLGIDDCLGTSGQQPELLEDVVAALADAGTLGTSVCSITIKETFRYMLSAHPEIQRQFVEGVRLIKSFTFRSRSAMPVSLARCRRQKINCGWVIRDLVGMSRALFADNDLISKSLAGHEDQVQQCRFDGNC